MEEDWQRGKSGNLGASEEQCAFTRSARNDL